MVIVDLCGCLPSEGLALSPVVVSSVELSQFRLEVGQGCECDLRYQLPPEDLVVSLDLASPSRVIRPTVDRLDVVSGQLRLELLRDELFAVRAGLRLLQCKPDMPQSIRDVATVMLIFLDGDNKMFTNLGGGLFR